MDKLINISGRRNVGDCVGDINANFEYLDNKTGSSGGVTVDTEMSTVSTNPVQNKVVTKAINDVTNAVNDKVSKTSEGATELLNTLGESNATPGTEDSFIVKSLNQYTRRPFTALLNWIKSNLAKVATSGSYNDLSDKPTIPKAVTVDAELSGTSTNPLQNKTVKAKFDAVDSQISSLSTDNGNLWAKVKTKADNTAEGATALLGNLSESTTAPGDEDEVIIKNLNQYTHRPLTKLLDWIKASLAKVATSGSYSDLKDKPGVTADVTSGDGSLITSGGVYSKLRQYRPMVNLTGINGKRGYVCFAELKVSGTYVNAPIEFKISSRGRFICNVAVRFANKGNTDPDMETLSFCGDDYKIYAYKSATSTWQLYALKSEDYDSISVLATYQPGQFNGTITHPGTFVATKHTGTTTNPVVDSTWGYKVGTADNSVKWNGLTDDTMTANTTDTRLMVLNGNKVQHRQIDTLPFLSSSDLAQPVLYTSTTTTTSATVSGLFDYSLIWLQVVGSKTTHTHILPLTYLKSKGSLTFKDSGTPINILYVSDTQIRWFEYQGSGAETYSSATIVKII